jgi:hypothetical protein
MIIWPMQRRSTRVNTVKRRQRKQKLKLKAATAAMAVTLA